MTSLALLLAVPALAANVHVETRTPSGSGAVGAAGASGVATVPASLNSAQLTPTLPVLSAPNLGALPGALPPPLPASAVVIDPAALPATGKHFTGAEWAKLAASAPDDGARAVLRTMQAGTQPQLTVKLADGGTLSGSFLGMAGDKMAFSSGGKLLGLPLDTRDIMQVTRTADVWFDGGTLRPEEVVVHDRSKAVSDPFKDLGAFRGRELEIDTRDLDDLKWSAHTVSGRLTKAGADGVELEGPKGTAHVEREFHRIDAVRARRRHFDSKGQVSSLSDVNEHIEPGTPVELAAPGLREPAKGFFRGVRSDAQGLYVLLETPNSDGSLTMRGYRDAAWVRTQGYQPGALMDGAQTLYTAPDR